MDGRKTINPEMRACMYASDPHSFWCDCTVYIVLRIWFFEHEYRKQTATHKYNNNWVLSRCYLWEKNSPLTLIIRYRYGKKLLDLYLIFIIIYAQYILNNSTSEQFVLIVRANMIWYIHRPVSPLIFSESIRRHMFYFQFLNYTHHSLLHKLYTHTHHRHKR